jgi:hypothetical protein
MLVEAMAKKTRGQKVLCMVGGGLIEGLSELSIRQILLKIAAVWGAVFFESKKTVNTVTQGPEFAEAWGLLAGPALYRSP